MASGLTGVISSGMSSVESNLNKLVMGTESWRAALSNIVTTIESSVIGAIIKMGVQWVANQILMATEGKAIAAANTAALAPIAAAESAVWLGPATLATIASFGGAAAAAPGEMLAAIAGTQGLALASDGGYFPGNESAARGIFHGGEYIFSAPAVRNIGADNLEAAHQMAKSGGGGGGGGMGGGSAITQSFHMHADFNSAFQAALKDPANKRTIIDTHKMSARHI